MTITDYLSQQKSIFRPLLDEYMEAQIERYAGLTEEYTVLLSHLRRYMAQGGKWHRPGLSLLTYQVSGGKNVDLVRKPALITEIMHRFLLIHDDIIDQDLFRHGEPTIEKIYQDYFKKTYPQKNDVIFSKANAIVAGDMVAILGSQIALESGLSSQIQLGLIAAINQMIMETAAGWQLQNEQNYKLIKQVSYDDFFKGMQMVSCQYSIVWPLRIGQILAGKLSLTDWDKNLETYGWHSGATFQIIDDIIGMFGDEKITGKPAGHDYREGKKTHLVLRAFENADQNERMFLERTLGKDIGQDELGKVQNIMVATGALEYSRQLAKDHAEKALEALRGVKSSSKTAIELLADFTRFLVARRY